MHEGSRQRSGISCTPLGTHGPNMLTHSFHLSSFPPPPSIHPSPSLFFLSVSLCVSLCVRACMHACIHARLLHTRTSRCLYTEHHEAYVPNQERMVITKRCGLEAAYHLVRSELAFIFQVGVHFLHLVVPLPGAMYPGAQGLHE